MTILLKKKNVNKWIFFVNIIIVVTVALGSQPRQGGCKVVGQEGSPGIMPHAPRSAKECEGIDSDIPKGTPTLGVGVPVDSQMFKEQFQGSKPNGSRNFFYH
jgi:hypothetical protein